MTDPEVLAELHKAAFTEGRPWHAAEFESLFANPHVAVHTHPHGFALARLVAGEAELLTVAVDPAFQRQGIASALLNEWLKSLQGRAEIAFLDVAADNYGARALYVSLGFVEVARRAGYYARTGAPNADAVIMQLVLTKG